MIVIFVLHTMVHFSGLKKKKKWMWSLQWSDTNLRCQLLEMTFINHAAAPGLSLSPRSPCHQGSSSTEKTVPTAAPHARVQDGLRASPPGGLGPGGGARGGPLTAAWLLTHDSTREKCRSLTHLLWRVLQTTRKAITLQVIRSTSAYDSALIPLLKSQLWGGSGGWRAGGRCLCPVSLYFKLVLKLIFSFA